MNWIHQYQNELQAISGLAIAVLTLVLIIVTAVYAKANWHTMRIVEADVRFRTKPTPRLGLSAANAWNQPGGQLWIMTVRTEHAPLSLIGVSIRFAIGPKETEYLHSFRGDVIHQAETFQHNFEVALTAAPQGWILQLYYRDHIGMLDYATNFDPKGFVSEEPTINRRTSWNRLRFWIGVKRIRRQMGVK